MTLAIEICFIVVVILLLIINGWLLILRKRLKSQKNLSKLSGFEVALGVTQKLKKEVHIIKKKGLFLDHYNYERKTIKLSSEVFDGEDMYAAVVALNIALKTEDGFKNMAKLVNFLVLISYVIIALGGLLNKLLVLNFGLVLFVGAFILETWEVYMFIIGLDNVVIDKKLIKGDNDITKMAKEASLIDLARIPYGFINYFR